MTKITIKIPFLSWSSKSDLSVEIDAGIEARFHLRTAVMHAVSQNANLDGANLTRANLGGANLGGASLIRASLTRANLTRANLTRANLDGANLTRANLTRANLGGASLIRASLTRANLTRANLTRANLDGANLDGAQNVSELVQAQCSIVPQDGTFVGWKKFISGDIGAVLIPVTAKRSNATGRKCRAEFVETLAIYAPGCEKARPASEVAVSQHDGKTTYKVGEITRCDVWCEDRFKECAGGIHFFLTRIEAENY